MLQLRHRLSLVVLLLLSVIHLSVPMSPMEQCTEWCSHLNEPSSCSDYQQVRVNKTAEIYRVRFCLDHQCNEAFTFNFRCCQICEACDALVPNGKNGNTGGHLPHLGGLLPLALLRRKAQNLEYCYMGFKTLGQGISEQEM